MRPVLQVDAHPDHIDAHVDHMSARRAIVSGPETEQVGSLKPSKYFPHYLRHIWPPSLLFH